MIRWFGPRFMRPVLASMKVRGLSALTQSHALSQHEMPTSSADIGKRHRKTAHAGNLRAAVFGINDGLVSNASLIIGMLGTGSSIEIVTLAGVAGALAGALSMASGEFISVLSQNEMVAHQIEIEREELKFYPEEEKQELSLIYQARGLSPDLADHVASILVSNPQTGLAILTQEELGVSLDDLGSPWQAGLSSFFCFVIGAIIPMIPLFVTQYKIIEFTSFLTAIALFAVGMLTGLLSGKNMIISGLRMLFIGGGAGLIAYFVGKMLG